MFLSASPREKIPEKQNELFPSGPVIKCLLLSGKLSVDISCFPCKRKENKISHRQKLALHIPGNEVCARA